jgi:hypothetical protein
MIEQYSYGNIVINGEKYMNDVKILQGSVVPSWWRKSGHNVEIEDVGDIIEAQPEVLVLGKGQPGHMTSSSKLQEFLKKRDIELIEEKTTEAVETFNRLFQEGKNVAAGFHLSC